jgi:hypothetical protein
MGSGCMDPHFLDLGTLKLEAFLFVYLYFVLIGLEVSEYIAELGILSVGFGARNLCRRQFLPL